MAREYNFKNVVGVKRYHNKEFPMWSDYGILVCHHLIDCIEDGKIVRHDISELVDYDYIETPTINLEYANKELINSYKETWAKLVLKKDSVFSLKELLGLEWKIVKGRKYSKGTTFINKFSYRYDIGGTYGHKWVNYLCDSENWRERNIKVNMANCEVSGRGELNANDIYRFDYIVNVDDLNKEMVNA